MANEARRQEREARRKQLGAKIEARRTELGLTLEELAEQAGFRHYQDIIAITKGRVGLGYERALRLAPALRWPLEELGFSENGDRPIVPETEKLAQLEELAREALDRLERIEARLHDLEAVEEAAPRSRRASR